MDCKPFEPLHNMFAGFPGFGMFLQNSELQLLAQQLRHQQVAASKATSSDSNDDSYNGSSSPRQHASTPSPVQQQNSPIEKHSSPLEPHSSPLEPHSSPLEPHSSSLEQQNSPINRKPIVRSLLPNNLTCTASRAISPSLQLPPTPLAISASPEPSHTSPLSDGLLAIKPHNMMMLPTFTSPTDIMGGSSAIARALSLTTSQQRRPRSEKKSIPTEHKDNKYFERRKRNNLAAKKSRDARKQREDEISMRANFLEKENAILRAQVATLREEANSLRQLMIQKRSRSGQ